MEDPVGSGTFRDMTQAEAEAVLKKNAFNAMKDMMFKYEDDQQNAALTKPTPITGT